MGKIGENEIHESITTNDAPPTRITHDPTPAYLHMNPITVYPKQETRLNRMPAFAACKRLYACFVKSLRRVLRQAQDCNIETDFLFRELVFAMMCFASCSPECVRFICIRELWPKGGDFHWACGPIWDRSEDATLLEKTQGFIGEFLHGYHLEGREPGIAPQFTSYWFSGALVYLRRDITSREKFRDAIVSAVAKGRADGQTHFSAIVLSLEHFILLKFADGNVQHTKRLSLGARPGFVWRRIEKKSYADEEVERPQSSDKEGDINTGEHSEEGEHIKEDGDSRQNSTTLEITTNGDGDQPAFRGAQGHYNNCDWADNSPVVAFKILAHFFDVTQKQQFVFLHNINKYGADDSLDLNRP